MTGNACKRQNASRHEVEVNVREPPLGKRKLHHRVGNCRENSSQERGRAC